MNQSKKSYQIPIIILFSLIFIFVYPRVLIANFGEASPWTSYFYLYGFGGYFFSIGLLLITKTKACVFGRGQDSKWFNILCCGFVSLACMHAVWIYLALSIPFKGGVN